MNGDGMSVKGEGKGGRILLLKTYWREETFVTVNLSVILKKILIGLTFTVRRSLGTSSMTLGF
jgi:hypothetical protein